MNQAMKIALIGLLSLLVFGCTAKDGMNNKNLGSIQENQMITKQYTNLMINPDFNYYYYGREIQPDVIMGIMKNYRVESDFWHQIQPSEDQLEKWVIWGERGRNDQCASRRYMGRYQGADIIDPDGNIIGNWYSKRDWGIFEFPGNDTVIVHPPRNYEGWSINTCT